RGRTTSGRVQHRCLSVRRNAAGLRVFPSALTALVALPVMNALRVILRPVGCLMFAVSLLALSSAARLLGEDDELGFFAGRLSGTLWRYPEVTRRGVQMAWLVWAALFALAASPLDPIATPWDEV